MRTCCVILVLLYLAGATATGCYLDDPNSEAPLVALLGGEVYTPEYAGQRQVFFAANGTQIFVLAGEAEQYLLAAARGPYPSLIQAIDVSDCYVMPGFIDMHMHVTGAGGELGPVSRTPEAQLSDIIKGGIATVVGLRGTDTVTRSLPNLVAKLRALAAGGLTPYMWTGGYTFPPPTATGSLMDDLALIDLVIGVGEIALSDSRSSNPTPWELARVIGDARVGGLLSGKAGVSYFHMGSGSAGLGPLWDVLKTTAVPIENILPTHMSGRGPALLEEGKKWIAAGGYVDFTADGPGDPDNSTVNALLKYYADRVPLDRVTMSTDASFPTIDARGEITGYSVGMPDALLHTVQAMVLDHGWPLERVLPLVTSTPAKVLKLATKGKLQKGYDADVLVLEKATLKPRYLFAKGKVLMTPNCTATGMFPCSGGSQGSSYARTMPRSNAVF